MLNRRLVLRVFVLLCMLSAIAYADQPNMQAARANLQQARAQLQAATHNKGGHRTNAIEHVNNALAFVNQGIAYDRRHNHAVSGSNELLGAAVVDQPHMQSALELLRSARTNLENATTDKGGYRKKAIDEVNKAIDETKKGIDSGE